MALGDEETFRLRVDEEGSLQEFVASLWAAEPTMES
jgi:hypothetical protein